MRYQKETFSAGHRSPETSFTATKVKPAYNVSKTDLWAVGCFVWQMCFGTTPFTSEAAIASKPLRIPARIHRSGFTYSFRINGLVTRIKSTASDSASASSAACLKESDAGCIKLILFNTTVNLAWQQPRQPGCYGQWQAQPNPPPRVAVYNSAYQAQHLAATTGYVHSNLINNNNGGGYDYTRNYAYGCNYGYGYGYDYNGYSGGGGGGGGYNSRAQGVRGGRGRWSHQDRVLAEEERQREIARKMEALRARARDQVGVLDPATWLFCDADGVLVDFVRGVKDLCGRLPDEFVSKNEMWETIARVDQFYLRLPWTTDGKELWAGIASFKPAILTGLPRGNWAEPQKRQWFERELGGSVPVIAVDVHLKHMCSGTNHVLIDNEERHKAEWEAAGGTFILHTSTDQTLVALRQFVAEHLSPERQPTVPTPTEPVPQIVESTTTITVEPPARTGAP
ncbi:DNA repair exonuclease SbcCD D subunit [Pelomyxa schiedti]|nr:DNA repair exonuclease SbcCD D subunit [Pelomyxa schiedti]